MPTMHDQEQVGPEAPHDLVKLRMPRFRVRVGQSERRRGVRQPLGEYVSAREELVVDDEDAGRHGNTSASGWRGKHVSAVCRLQLMTSTPAAVSGPAIAANIVRKSA